MALKDIWSEKSRFKEFRALEGKSEIAAYFARILDGLDMGQKPNGFHPFFGFPEDWLRAASSEGDELAGKIVRAMDDAKIQNARIDVPGTGVQFVLG